MYSLAISCMYTLYLDHIPLCFSLSQFIYAYVWICTYHSVCAEFSGLFTCGRQFSPSTVWVPGIELRLLDLVVSTYTL